MKLWKKILLVMMILLFISGMVYMMQPVIVGLKQDQDAKDGINTFEEYVSDVWGDNMDYIEIEDPESESGFRVIRRYYGDYTVDDVPYYADLLKQMQSYNEQIFEEEQINLCDPWAYEQPSFNLTEYGLPDGVIGVLRIPKINESLPIFLGASYQNMKRGAVHLSQTSLPIGGNNTNSVIAGHRGWSGSNFFRYLDQLQVGDRIYIDNLWGTLVYQVCEIKIIDPNDVDSILIQPGRELVTLLTCHPYASGGKYRLVVFCERVNVMASRVIEYAK